MRSTRGGHAAQRCMCGGIKAALLANRLRIRACYCERFEYPAVQQSEMAHRRNIRRICRRLLRNRRVRWAAAILGIGFLLWFAFAPGAGEAERSARPSGGSIVVRHPARVENAPFSDSGAGRFAAVLYPYSVIPGGVQSIAELSSALARDPTVAAHYGGFDVARARLVHIDRERSAFVSYRLGDHIFWTSHKLTLRQGETVITDGDHTARTRCGNLVADVPLGPLSPREPAPEIFDTPVTLDMPFGPVPRFDLPPTPEWILEPPTIGTGSPRPGGGLSIFPSPFPPATSTLPTPEPGVAVLLLICAGFVIFLVLRRARKNRLAHL